MSQPKLEHCKNSCCYFVDEKKVAKEEYEEAHRRHPARMPGVGPGHRNAILQTEIACLGNDRQRA